MIGCLPGTFLNTTTDQCETAEQVTMSLSLKFNANLDLSSRTSAAFIRISRKIESGLDSHMKTLNLTGKHLNLLLYNLSVVL
jgi:hypothetical protein